MLCVFLSFDGANRLGVKGYACAISHQWLTQALFSYKRKSIDSHPKIGVSDPKLRGNDKTLMKQIQEVAIYNSSLIM